MKLLRHVSFIGNKFTGIVSTSYQFGICDYSTSKQSSPAEYCVDMVRTHDYENFLCTLLLPNECRTSAFAIRAFNIEVARVQDSVSEVTIGQMRMKFWEDTLEKIYQNDVPKHPVAMELYRAVKRHKLSKRYLKRLISVRANHLITSTYPNIEAMESYAENSVSSVLYLMLECSGLQNVHADHAASHLGKAQGITNLIRSIPHNAQHRVIPLPQDVLVKHSVSQEMVVRGSREKPLRDVIFDVACRARQHLDKARSLSSDVPKSAHVIFLPAITIDSYLEKLQQSDFDVFDGSLQQRNNFLPISLLWNKLRLKY
ncbi:NADH dehydrogenase (ubiquinone) complex I, assembly factor 6 isoform X1 [Anabrus simplex]|uniref:NADH dehydrogenase (ubiquinone) complex I, assembly factor 6 isoform X1 n=2 Tax=Anabrus simplex TaxID=316456 RepID=UPI0034DD6193